MELRLIKPIDGISNFAKLFAIEIDSATNTGNEGTITFPKWHY